MIESPELASYQLIKANRWTFPLDELAVMMRCCTRVAGAQEGDISGLIKLTCVKAEHSTYFTAVSSFASILPCSNLIGISWFLESSFNVAGSSRRSIFKPTSRNGVFSQCSVISGTHYNEASGHLLTQWHDTHCSYVGFTHTNHPPTHVCAYKNVNLI